MCIRDRGCAFVDYDRDGKLDLVVSNYVLFDVKTAPKPGEGLICVWKGTPVMCGPRGLESSPNIPVSYTHLDVYKRQLKEYQIATEVFGRPENFDPQADSAIRVQAGRLRLKLLDYYNHEGVSDSIVVEMPAGSYVLNFHDREPVSARCV